MTFQNAGTPWGSGATGGSHAESELCAAWESKWGQPRSRRVDSIDEGCTFPSAGPAEVGMDQARPGGPPSVGSVARMDTRPLKVVYWNVAGINVRDIDDFFDNLDFDIQWGVLVLLEFSAAYKEMHLSGVRRAGHLLCAQPNLPGRRAGGSCISSTT